MKWALLNRQMAWMHFARSSYPANAPEFSPELALARRLESPPTVEQTGSGSQRSYFPIVCALHPLLRYIIAESYGSRLSPSFQR